ncbi:ras-related gtp binding c [Sesbania bispinosa]|nr:ras-related gtp binding c [Sesbania bispinosa]
MGSAGWEEEGRGPRWRELGNGEGIFHGVITCTVEVLLSHEMVTQQLSFVDEGKSVFPKFNALLLSHFHDLAALKTDLPGLF